MAKVGYIYADKSNDSLTADKEWMQRYGCIKIFEDVVEKERPVWHQLLRDLDRGDELVVAKFSNAVRGILQLSMLVELCRVKVVRLISIRDRIDTNGELFPDTTQGQIMSMIGSLPAETITLRKAGEHEIHLKQRVVVIPKKTTSKERKREIEKLICTMYKENHSIDDIWRASGFRSRSSVFRILNKYGIKLKKSKFNSRPRPEQDKTNSTK